LAYFAQKPMMSYYNYTKGIQLNTISSK